jgi:hypothetical protein
MTFSLSIYNGIIKDVADRSNLYSTVSEIDDLVRENYFGEINENYLNTMMSDGYVEGIGDRYSYYMTATEYANYKEEEKQLYSAIEKAAIYPASEIRRSKDTRHDLESVMYHSLKIDKHTVNKHGFWYEIYRESANNTKGHGIGCGKIAQPRVRHKG